MAGLKQNFSDTEWKEGTGPFAAPNTPNIRVGTAWRTADIWMRRRFEWPQTVGGEVTLLVYHDEDAEIYINGVVAAKLRGFAADYVSVSDLGRGDEDPQAGEEYAGGALPPDRRRTGNRCRDGDDFISEGKVVSPPRHEDTKRDKVLNH